MLYKKCDKEGSTITIRIRQACVQSLDGHKIQLYVMYAGVMTELRIGYRRFMLRFAAGNLCTRKAP